MTAKLANKVAGLCGLLSCIALIAIWRIFLGETCPDDVAADTMASLRYVLSPETAGTYFFIYSLLSLLVCLISSGVLLFTRNPSWVMYVIMVHALLALFIYDISLVIAIALPLLYFRKVGDVMQDDKAKEQTA